MSWVLSVTWSILHTLSHGSFQTAPREQYCSYPDFVDEETEPQKRNSLQVAEPACVISSPRCLIPEPSSLITTSSAFQTSVSRVPSSRLASSLLFFAFSSALNCHCLCSCSVILGNYTQMAWIWCTGHIYLHILTFFWCDCRFTRSCKN